MNNDTTMNNEIRRDSVMADGSIDWEDVERKVQIISNRFATTIDWKYREDMEQELRLFAWQKSSNYWDMYRRAVDYFRTLTRKVYPEICVFEFDDNNGQGGVTEDKYLEDDNFETILKKIREEINKFSDGKIETRERDNSLKILDFIENYARGNHEEDIKFTKGKIQVTYLMEKTGIDYSKIQEAYWFLQQVVKAMIAMGKIQVSGTVDTTYFPF